MERTGAPLPTAGSRVPGVRVRPNPVFVHTYAIRQDLFLWVRSYGSHLQLVTEPSLLLSIPTEHSHLQSFATPPPRVAVRRREVIRHADGRGWEKMENVEFRNFLSITSRKSYCISKIIIFETVSRWLTCDYSPRNNTMSHLLPAVIWWPSSRCTCCCLLIGGKLNSIEFLWRYLMSWIKVNDT